MHPRIRPWLSDTALLWLPLALVGLIHGLRLLGVELPYLERSAPARLHRHPDVSAAVALFLAAAILVLWFAPAERRPLRLGVGGVLFLAGLASGLLFDPMLGVSFFLAAGPLLRGGGSAGTPGSLRPGPHNPRVSLWTLLLPLLAALLATAATSKLRTGAFVPDPGAEQQLRASARYLSAAPVLLVPAVAPSGVRLVPAPLGREELVRRIRDEGRGWTVAQMLEVLEQLEVLPRLPPTDLQHASALVGPTLGSGVPSTAEDGAVVGRPHWGVVVEAERDDGQRLLFLSLGEGEPSERHAPYHHLLFRVPEQGGTPLLLRVESFSPSASGFEVITLPGVFLLSLVSFLVLSVVVTWVWTTSRPGPAQRAEGAP